MKKKPLPPRATRMTRSARLQSARYWLPKYEGKNVVRGYKKHFAVDLACALKELELLGVKIDPTHKQQLLTTIANAGKAKAKKKRVEQREEVYLEPDENSAYVGGCTEAGSAYGVSWEELDSISAVVREDDAFDIPF